MKKRKVSVVKFLLAPLVILIGVLGYYQFLYKSKRVDSGIVQLNKMFSGFGHVVTSARFTPDDSLVVASSADSTIRFWDKNSGQLVKEFKQPVGVSYMDISHDGKFIVFGAYDSKVRIIRADDGAIVKTFAGHKGTIWTVAFSPDDTKVASAGDDATVNVWDVEKGNLIRSLKGHTRIVWSVRFSPDGTKVASSSFDYTFKLWNLADGSILWDNKEHTETVVDVAFSNKGKLLASTSDDKTIKIWDIGQQKLLRTMEVAEHVQAVAFSPDDRRLMTGGRDKPMIGELLQNFFGDSKINRGVSARLWDVNSGELLYTFTTHANDVQDVDYSHDGKWILTASADKTVGLWKVVR